VNLDGILRRDLDEKRSVHSNTCKFNVLFPEVFFWCLARARLTLPFIESPAESVLQWQLMVFLHSCLMALANGHCATWLAKAVSLLRGVRDNYS
jgi:hypothetical protein